MRRGCRTRLSSGTSASPAQSVEESFGLEAGVSGASRADVAVASSSTTTSRSRTSMARTRSVVLLGHERHGVPAGSVAPDRRGRRHPDDRHRCEPQRRRRRIPRRVSPRRVELDRVTNDRCPPEVRRGGGIEICSGVAISDGCIPRVCGAHHPARALEPSSGRATRRELHLPLRVSRRARDLGVRARLEIPALGAFGAGRSAPADRHGQVRSRLAFSPTTIRPCRRAPQAATS